MTITPPTMLCHGRLAAITTHSAAPQHLQPAGVAAHVAPLAQRREVRDRVVRA